jgi:hypothetical protein
MTMEEALTYWIANGQTGFFPPKGGVNGKASRPKNFIAMPRADDAAALKQLYRQPAEGEFS